MKIFEFIFHLGIVFAIFGFVWFFLMLGINLLMAGKRTKFLNYLYKLIKYMFLSSVTARFIWEFSGEDISSRSGISYFLIGGLILLMYLLGKLQRQENLQQMQAMMSKMMPGMSEPFYDRKFEIATIGIGIINFVVCVFYPEILSNAFINWFSETIHGIYEAPIIGFIFKIVGFFFLLSIIFKGITSIGRSLGLMPPAPEVNANANFNMFNNFQDTDNQNPNEDNDGFDKYEVVEDEELGEGETQEDKKDEEDE